MQWPKEKRQKNNQRCTKIPHRKQKTEQYEHQGLGEWSLSSLLASFSYILTIRLPGVFFGGGVVGEGKIAVEIMDIFLKTSTLDISIGAETLGYRPL